MSPRRQQHLLELSTREQAFLDAAALVRSALAVGNSPAEMLEEAARIAGQQHDDIAVMSDVQYRSVLNR